MPTYQYRCADCGRELEVVQKFTDASLTECPTCTGDLRKVFSAVGVVFKGSGFYATDNRAQGKSDAAKPTTPPAEKKPEKKTEKKTEKKADTTPAPAS